MMPKITHYTVLEKVVNDRNIKRIAEIGVWKGSLTRHLTRLCPSIREYYGIDPWKKLDGDDWGRMNQPQEFWEQMYIKACQNLPYHRGLKLIRMSGLEAVNLFPIKKFTGFFDLVYIDSTHRYQETYDEIKVWLPLVHKGGLIGGHDYGSKRLVHQGVTQAVDELFSKDRLILLEDMVWLVEI